MFRLHRSTRRARFPSPKRTWRTRRPASPWRSSKSDAAKAQLAQAQANDVKAQNDLAATSSSSTSRKFRSSSTIRRWRRRKRAAPRSPPRKPPLPPPTQQSRRPAASWRRPRRISNAQTGPSRWPRRARARFPPTPPCSSKQAALEQAELNLQYTKIVAPVNGIVTKNVEVGMNVQPGQQLLTDRSARRCLGHRQLQGNAAEVYAARASARKSKSTPTAAPTKGTWTASPDRAARALSLLPPENATGNYVKVVQRVPVKIVLDPGQNSDHYLRLGMSVEPKVFVK